jgi:hypothetical protein
MYNYTDNKYAYVGAEIPISSANINETGLMLYKGVNFTVQNSISLLDTANSNLDGAGTLVTIITGASNGTMIKRITIKARETTSKGMIRFFVQAAAGAKLLREIEVPATTQSSRDDAFTAVIDEIFYIESGYILKASTENGDEFVVFTESVNVTFPR